MNEPMIQLVLFAGTAVVGGVALAVRWVYRKLVPPPPPPPVVRIADAPDGAFVRVIGKVVDGGALVAPISGRRCVCFHALVSWEEHGRIAGEVLRRVVANPLRGTPFVIDDGSGKAMVDPRGAFVRVPVDLGQRWVHGPRTTADPELVPIAFHGEPLLFQEGVLAIGDQVVVTAQVQKDDGQGPEVYRALATTIRLVGGKQRSAEVSSLPHELEAAQSCKQ